MRVAPRGSRNFDWESQRVVADSRLHFGRVTADLRSALSAFPRRADPSTLRLARLPSENGTSSRNSNFPNAANAAHSGADDRRHFLDCSSYRSRVDIILYGAGRIRRRRPPLRPVFENGRARSAFQTSLQHRPGHRFADATTVET